MMKGRKVKWHPDCRLYDILSKKGISEGELAKMTGYSQSHISKIVGGADLLMSTAQDISEAVGKEIKYIWPHYKFR